MRDTFAKIELIVSDPIIPFRETALPPNSSSLFYDQIETITANKQGVLRLRALTLPKPIYQFIDEHSTILTSIVKQVNNKLCINLMY